MEGRDSALPQHGGMDRPAVRLGRRGRGQAGGARDHPAGRLREGRGRDRGRRSARCGDGADRPAAVPALTTMTNTPSMRDQLTPYADAERPPYLIALIVSLGALGLYALTLAPTTQFWDASEYITTAHALGIPHPPGNPVFVLLAHAWGLLPLGADYARRINLLAAVSSAAAAGFWFLIGERWLRPIVPPTGPRRLAAAAGAVVGATAFTVWNQSVANEKVYTLSVLSIALVLWLVVRWGDQPSEGRRDHWPVLLFSLLALTATHHFIGRLLPPPLLACAPETHARALPRP